MKKITSILLVVLLVLTCLTMAACDPKNPIDPTVPFDTAGAQAALDLYIFEDDGLVISGEFVLPGNIGGFDATWTSSSDVVTLTEIPASEENGTPKQYAVKVGYPEAVTDVTLTVSLSADVTKTFTVIVNPISVHDFISAYTFDNDKNTVVADFDLDRTCEYAGKTATIDWSVDAEYADYLEISEDGNTCIVYPTSLNPTVKINATFTYNGDSATKSYRMTVSEVKDHLQAVDYWYANTGVGMEMRGYVVEIATVYAPNYANISLYIVDEDFCAGYYLYRVKCDQATADRLVPGAPVVVTGTINTNYNGLIETNAGGTIVIDDEREALTELPVHALDEEVVGGLFSANYHQSTLVSLTNWKVKEVKDAPKAGETATLFILEKGGVEVAVAVSKYMEGAYKTAADDTVWSALAAHGIQVGDIVSVTGVLGNYKGHQIMPLSIDGIVKGDTESTYTAGVTAASAVAAIDKALADNGLNSVVAVEKNVALPTVDGATVTAKVLGASRAVTVVDGAIVVAPGKLENACVQIDITVGEFTNSIFRYIMSADLDDAEKLAMELPVLDIDFELAAEDTVLNLPATGSMFPAINVTWAFKADTTHDCATLDGNVLTITLPEVATSITIVATLSLGEAEVVTKEFTIAVDAASLDQYVAKPVEEPAVDTAYKFAVVQNLAGGTFYFTGEMSGNYLATTDKANKAVDVKLEAATDGYYLYFMDGDTKTYIEIYEYQENKGGVRLVTSAPASVFVINADYNMPTTTIGANTYYLGSYKTYTTMSVSNITYMSAEKDGVSQFGARLSTIEFVKESVEDETPDDGGETPEPTPVEKITTIAGALAVESGEAELSGTVAKITYAWNGTTCSFDLTDGTNTINVYKSTTNVTVGDVVTVVGNISVYNNKHQISEGSTVTVTTAHVCADWSDADCENPALCTVCGAAKADSQALGHTEANNEGKCDRCGVALKVAAGTYTYDIVNSFGTYANDWSSSYVAHETASTDFTGTLPKATITFSRANKQAQTITDRPVLAPKGSTEYVTVVIEGNTISSVTFALTQWGTKTFSDIHIEYFDGTAWVSCSDTITTPANITSTTLPANVTQVRLSVTATGSSNIQVGIGDITVVVA